MESDRFDFLARTVSTLLSRRTLAAALGLGAVTLSGLVDAKKKKRKKRKKKITRNEFGCVNVGGFCKNSGQCCSGICEGKKDKKKCQAHNASTCAGQDACAGEFDPCTTDQGADGNCVVTTGDAGYCNTVSVCVDCSTDAECEPVCGAGAACIVCAECAVEELETACASAQETGCIPV